MRRLDDAPAFLDDVKQALRTRLDVESKSLEASSGRGPLVAWLRMAAGRIALNHLRPEKRAARADSAELDALPFGAPGPELDHAKLESFATPPRKPDPPKGKRGKAALVPTS
ncbi:MAG: hypothetical protein SFW67_21050 [Myxococcaceae bacterium]|nr:hypothetical protein [Myxococcaceae bacterium]